MKKVILALSAMLMLMAGCMADPGETGAGPADDVGESQSELAIGSFSGFGTAGVRTCPGGSAPACVSCSSRGQCTQACTGDYTCDITDEDLGGGSSLRICQSGFTCRTGGATPSFGSWTFRQ